MFHDPIQIPALIELTLLAIVLIVVSIARARQHRQRQRRRRGHTGPGELVRALSLEAQESGRSAGSSGANQSASNNFLPVPTRQA